MKGNRGDKRRQLRWPANLVATAELIGGRPPGGSSRRLVVARSEHPHNGIPQVVNHRKHAPRICLRNRVLPDQRGFKVKNPLGLPATGSATLWTADSMPASIRVRTSQFCRSVENSIRDSHKHFITFNCCNAVGH